MAITKRDLIMFIALRVNRLLACKEKMGNGMRLCLLSIFFLLFSSSMGFATNVDECFRLPSLRIGQYIEYQIIGLQNKNQEDRYRISVIGKESINEQEYFWIQIDVFSETKREISFKALISPLDQVQFSMNPELYISNGMLFLLRNAKNLFVSTDDNISYYEVPTNIFLRTSDILENSIYSDTPYEKNVVDYSKMIIHAGKESISVPAGNFECYHFEVKTHESDAYTDEGFDLWRSDKVPFLGIVKWEFSKTKYQKKWSFRYSQLFDTDDWWRKLYAFFFIRRVLNKNRSDTFVMRLIDYDACGFPDK